MPALVAAGRSFIPGLRAEMLGTYKRQYEAQREKLSVIMSMDLPSTKRTEFYFFWRSAPHIVKWAYGESMPESGFHGVRFNITNVRWGRAISWQADDRADDQTNSLMDQARGLGQSIGLLDERVALQIMQGTTDNDLLSDRETGNSPEPGNENTDGGIPTAPDGQSLFSTTRDGTNARFGATNGNLLTGTAVTTGPTESTMRADYWSAREQFALFQDTEGQPLLNPSIVRSQACFIFAANNWDTAAAAFQRSVIPESSAGVSNELNAEGLTPILWPTQRITTDDYFVGLSGVTLKALFSQNRQPIQEFVATKENSDLARQQDEESIRFKTRRGYGVAEPYALLEVNNVS